MHDQATLETLQRKFHALRAVLHERSRRLWAAAEALELGWGGISAVSLATGLARDTIRAGVAELRHPQYEPSQPAPIRLRRPGAGRKRLTERDPGLAAALDALVDPATRGDPMSPL